jgi:hypothetical protein
VEIQKSGGSFAYQDLIEYIEEGRKKISSNCNSQIQEKAIMVLGLIETGKTILVNYLNGVQLQCLRARVSKNGFLKWHQILPVYHAALKSVMDGIRSHFSCCLYSTW